MASGGSLLVGGWEYTRWRSCYHSWNDHTQLRLNFRPDRIVAYCQHYPTVVQVISKLDLGLFANQPRLVARSSWFDFGTCIRNTSKQTGHCHLKGCSPSFPEDWPWLESKLHRKWRLSVHGSRFSSQGGTILLSVHLGFPGSHDNGGILQALSRCSVMFPWNPCII